MPNKMWSSAHHACLTLACYNAHNRIRFQVQTLKQFCGYWCQCRPAHITIHGKVFQTCLSVSAVFVISSTKVDITDKSRASFSRLSFTCTWDSAAAARLFLQTFCVLLRLWSTQGQDARRPQMTRVQTNGPPGASDPSVTGQTACSSACHEARLSSADPAGKHRQTLVVVVVVLFPLPWPCTQTDRRVCLSDRRSDWTDSQPVCTRAAASTMEVIAYFLFFIFYQKDFFPSPSR